MQFKRNTVTLSVGYHAAPIFESLDRIKPDNMSFSLFLAVVADDYVKSKKKTARITDFDHEDVIAELPLFYASILKWEKHIINLNTEDFKKLQKRFSQLGSLISKEVEKRL
jgi:hypothetical protein